MGDRFHSIIKSMRLRTLPLSLAGVIVGVALASSLCEVKIPVVAALVLTTAFLQILSNLSNELGDTLHGTDTSDRQGIHYSIQDGEMTVPQMKRLIVVVAGLCCVCGTAMIFCSFGTLLAIEPVCCLLLGISAIWAAMSYTLGKNPYGYRGLGDIFVFIFFGLVAVLGAGYICSHTIRLLWLLPSAAFGCWSIGVLNVNNIRDMKTDATTRTTVALRLGLRRSRVYQTVLIALGWALMTVYSLHTASEWAHWGYFITLPLYVLHLRGVWTREERALDPMLPMLVMTTFVTSILFAAGTVCNSPADVTPVAVTEQEKDLQTGDLIFVSLPDYTFPEDTILIHTAMVETDAIRTFIVDATIKRGVDRYPIDTFLMNFRRHDGTFPKFEVLRLRDTSGVSGFLKNAKGFIGETYNVSFSRNKGSHYCTELVYDSFIRDGEHLFIQDTLDFTNGKGEFYGYWVKIFGKLGTEVPQGMVGITPAQMHSSPQLEFVRTISPEIILKK